MLIAVLRAPQLGHRMRLAWADGGPLVYCALCAATCRRYSTSIERPCKPERCHHRSEGKRLRNDQAPDTGTPLQAWRYVESTCIEQLRVEYLSFCTEDVGCQAPGAKRAVRQRPLVRRRLTAKTGPFGDSRAGDRRRLGTKQRPRTCWHLFCSQRDCCEQHGHNEEPMPKRPEGPTAAERIEGVRQRLKERMDRAAVRRLAEAEEGSD